MTTSPASLPLLFLIVGTACQLLQVRRKLEEVVASKVHWQFVSMLTCHFFYRFGFMLYMLGFFGPVPGGLLKSIGRGYTDLAAALLAVGLGAEELQIWKEVDGIFTADPRKVQGAR